MITEPAPTRKEGQKGLSPKEAAAIGGVKVQTLERDKSVFIRLADREFQAAFPKRDRLRRDMSDAPAELRESLMRQYEMLTSKESKELATFQRESLLKLERLMPAIGYTLKPKEFSDEQVAKIKALEAQAAAKQKTTQLAGGKEATQVSQKAPKPQTPKPSPERSNNDPKLDQLRKSPYWLVSDPDATGGTGIAIKVAPWYDRPDRQKGHLIGFKVLDTYASYKRFNPLAKEDMIKIDDQGNIEEDTRGEIEGRKKVPEELRQPGNAVKLSLLQAGDQIAPDIRYGTSN